MPRRSIEDYRREAAGLLGVDPDDWRSIVLADLARERDETVSQTARANLTRAHATKVAELRPPEADLVSRAMTWPELAERIAAGVAALPDDQLGPVRAALEGRP